MPSVLAAALVVASMLLAARSAGAAGCCAEPQQAECSSLRPISCCESAAPLRSDAAVKASREAPALAHAALREPCRSPIAAARVRSAPAPIEDRIALATVVLRL